MGSTDKMLLLSRLRPPEVSRLPPQSLAGRQLQKLPLAGRPLRWTAAVPGQGSSVVLGLGLRWNRGGRPPASKEVVCVCACVRVSQNERLFVYLGVGVPLPALARMAELRNCSMSRQDPKLFFAPLSMKLQASRFRRSCQEAHLALLGPWHWKREVGKIHTQ